MSERGDQPAGPPVRSDEMRALIMSLRRFAEASDRAVEAAGQRTGLHRTDLRALTILVQRQAAGATTSPGDLGRLLNLTSASTTALVDRLVANGHAQRLASTTDRRRVQITHTPKAASDGARAFAPMGRLVADHLAGITSEQVQATLQVLAAATDAMDAYGSGAGSAGPATSPRRGDPA